MEPILRIKKPRISYHPETIMKNRKLLALGVTLVSVTLALAQETDVVRERNPLPADQAAVERDLAAMQGQRAQTAAKAERLAEVSHLEAVMQRKLALAQVDSGAFGYEAVADSFTTMPARSPRALVIPKEAGDAKSFAEVEEDLGVMAHILDKAVVDGDKTARAMGITVSGRAFVAGAAPQNLYVEGYGAIFLLKVNFPLQPPPNKETEVDVKEPVNNEWEEAKREMTRPGGKGQGGADPFIAFEERYGMEPWNAKSPSAEYDASKVEDLKKGVIGALKNAANVRRLKADETVTVVVNGADARMMTKSIKSSGGRYGNAKPDAVTVSKASSGERSKVSAGAKLIFRVRKADAEAFQNGKLDLDAFSKKVAVIAF
jgi:hypothetical protein